MKPRHEPIYHLLVPKEFRIWCRRNVPPGPKTNVTTKPSKCNCVNCLTSYRYDKSGGKKGMFRKVWTSRAVYSEKTPELEE